MNMEVHLGLLLLRILLRSLFGEIEDEHDSPKIYLKNKSDNDILFFFPQDLEVDYLNNKYKFNIPESDQYETIGWFYCSQHYKRFLTIGEVLNISSGYEFIVSEVTNTKIETVEVKIS